MIPAGGLAMLAAAAQADAAPADGSLADARVAARLCAHDPGLGGMVLRGEGRGTRDRVVAALVAAMPAHAPVRRLPGNADDERLLGGLDLGVALAGGGLVLRRGLLAEADGGLVLVPAAERLGEAVAARLGAALDTGEVAVERDGATLRLPARIIVAALDDGREPTERPPAALTERLAFHIDLDGAGEPLATADTDPIIDDRAIAAVAATAAALGVDSARASHFALRAARAAAALAGRPGLTEADLVLAIRLVLVPRATRFPAEDQAPDPPAPEDGPDESDGDGTGRLEDRVLDAARAALPADLLQRIAAGGGRGAGQRARGIGERRRSLARGRPAGTRAGKPGGGARLALVDTLRAAAPWQALRGRTGPIRIRRDDLRIHRFESRAEPVTIFAVDASGSAALARLAEAKGAIELLLAQAYVQRAQVALVAFRGTGAELLLPPTRSLTRARRALAELPGGGGTPLAAGLDAAAAVARTARARGATPFVVLLTDGRANIAADGRANRAAAEADATAAARAIAASRIPAIFIDTGARPRPEGARLAAAMSARYLPLPYADAHAVHAAVAAEQPARR